MLQSLVALVLGAPVAAHLLKPRSRSIIYFYGPLEPLGKTHQIRVKRTTINGGPDRYR